MSNQTATKHTPGPWRPGKNSDDVVADSPAGHDDETAVKYYGGHLVAESICSSNRALIAAAPELLVALELTRENLRACQATIHLCGGFDPAYVNDAQAAMKVADAAMAKARGQS